MLMQEMASKDASASGAALLVVSPESQPSAIVHLAAGSAVCAGTVDGGRVTLVARSATSDFELSMKLKSDHCLSLDLQSPDIVHLRLKADSRATIDGLSISERRTFRGAVALDTVATRPNVIVYLVDCLRADMLAAYGSSSRPAPQMDRYADEMVAIPSCTAQSSWTRASVASIFTGRWPLSNGVIGREDTLPEVTETIAEFLTERAGYDTAAFITNGNVGDQVGFAQGFDSFSTFGERKGAQLHTLSDSVNDALFEWIDSRDGGAPFFLYVHTMDPHSPYAPPAQYEDRLASTEVDLSSIPIDYQRLEAERLRFSDRFRPEVMGLRIGSMLWMKGLASSIIKPTPPMAQRLRALYEAEVSFNDESFGQLVRGLRQRDLDKCTVLFLVGDHGEEFSEHGMFEHGKNLYETSVAVPLVVGLPDGFGRLNTKRAAELVDLYPTIVEMAGAEAPDSLEGLSLLSLDDDLIRPRFSYVHLDKKHSASIQAGRWKLITTKRPHRTVTELFDLSTDPTEASDVSKDFPLVVKYLSGKLRHRIETSIGPERRRAEITQELREELEALGYLDPAAREK